MGVLKEYLKEAWLANFKAQFHRKCLYGSIEIPSCFSIIVIKARFLVSKMHPKKLWEASSHKKVCASDKVLRRFLKPPLFRSSFLWDEGLLEIYVVESCNLLHIFRIDSQQFICVCVLLLLLQNRMHFQKGDEFCSSEVTTAPSSLRPIRLFTKVLEMLLGRTRSSYFLLSSKDLLHFYIYRKKRKYKCSLLKVFRFLPYLHKDETSP